VRNPFAALHAGTIAFLAILGQRTDESGRLLSSNKRPPGPKNPLRAFFRSGRKFLLVAVTLAVTDSEIRAQSNADASMAPDVLCRLTDDRTRVTSTLIRQPPPKQRNDVFPRRNQPLRLDFSPFDAEGFWHRGDLTLIFDDDGVLVFHHLLAGGRPLPIPLRLPDATVITPCDLLIAFPEQRNDTNAPDREDEKIPHEKIPHEKIP
jgi:hypothetical protein